MARDRREYKAANRARYRALDRWRTMIRRCTDPTHEKYPHYGGRGIVVCQEWLDSFDAYYAHIGDPPFPGATIDRENNDGNYEPGNVRWATAEQQRANRRYDHNKIKTQCPQGHEYDAKNTRVVDGKRYCKACGRDRAREKYQRSPFLAGGAK